MVQNSGQLDFSADFKVVSEITTFLTQDYYQTDTSKKEINKITGLDNGG